MTAVRGVCRFTAWMLTGLLLAACGAAPPMRGANFLQSGGVKMTSPRAMESLARLKAAGADTVAVVPFLEQRTPNDTRLTLASAVTEDELLAGLRAAKRLGFRLVLKPQILVPGGWPGEIDHETEADWNTWFASYRRHIAHFADIARREGVDIFVIGTELNHADTRPQWRGVIAEARARFNGEITYAAHNVEGVRRFAHWDELDSIAVTLYPSLDTRDGDAMSTPIERAAAELRALRRNHDKPLWVAEVGIPSRSGAESRPWEWLAVVPSTPPDEDLQASVIALWLDALRGSWNRGILIWCWTSDPDAGGPMDGDFTVQNKKAEAVVACRWRGRCGADS